MATAQPPHLQTAPPPFEVTPLGTVLITGGCGFLGSHIVQLLLSKSHTPTQTNIHVLDLRPPTEPFPSVAYHTADLTSSTSIRQLFDKISPDVVIHTASPVFNSSSGADAERVKKLMYKVNVEGTRILLEESKRVGVKAFVYTSSASVISDNRTDLLNADERYTLIRGALQSEFYTDTKAEAESLVLSSSTRAPLANSENLQPFLTTALRPASIFGERDVQFIPNLLNVVRTGRTKFQIGSNDNLFDVTYVGNVAQAHLQAAAKLVDLFGRVQKGGAEEKEDEGEGKVDGEAFIITNHSPVYFWDFGRAVWHTYYRLASVSAPALKKPATSLQAFSLPIEFMIVVATVMSWVTNLLGMPKPVLQAQNVRFSCMTRYFKTRKAEVALGYVPEVGLDEAVERTVRWFVEREGMEGRTVAGEKENQ